MTLQQLRYICAIDQWGHFGKAAIACHLTQSTLSLMLKKLEEELDVQIFDREAHPVVATEMGRKIIDKAKVVLYNVGQISEMTRSDKQLLSGPLKIAMISTLAPLLVAGMFKYLHDAHPDIELQTEEMISGTIKEKLRHAEIDMGLLTSPVNDAELMEIPLYTERFVAYVAENGPESAMESIPSSYLRSRSVWIMKNGLRQMDLSQIAAERNEAYEQYFEGGRVGTLLQIVNENGGITIIPETHTKFILYSWLSRIKPIVDSTPKRTISLVLRKDYIHEAMLNAVVKAIKSIIPANLHEGPIRHDHIKL